MGTIYENILSLCQSHNITGGKMCTDIGISKNTMTKLRKGEQKNINSDTAQKIADYFGVDVDVVLNGQKEKPAENGKLEKKAAIINTMDKMSDTELIEILDELRARPEMRMLFHSAKGATAEQLSAIAKMIDGFKS